MEPGRKKAKNPTILGRNYSWGGNLANIKNQEIVGILESEVLVLWKGEDSKLKKDPWKLHITSEQ